VIHPLEFLEAKKSPFLSMKFRASWREKERAKEGLFAYYDLKSGTHDPIHFLDRFYKERKLGNSQRM
jgi:hypothetical protein